MSIYLVTGAAGFIGSHICEELLKDNNNIVVGIDNFYSGNRENIDLLTGISKKFTFFEIDIREHEKVCELISEHNIEFIFHQAAIASVQVSIQNPQFTHDVNIAGSISVLEAARKHNIKRIVFASSAAVYGDEPTLPKNEKSVVQPISPYGLEKHIIEQYLELYAKQYGMECIALRYFNIYGPRQDPKSEYSGVISIFKDRILQGKPITIYGDGEQYRDFVFVKDVVAVNLSVMHLDFKGFKLFCVGSGVKTTLNQLVDLFSNFDHGPDVQVIYTDKRSGDINASVCDNSLLKKILGVSNFTEIYSDF